MYRLLVSVITIPVRWRSSVLPTIMQTLTSCLFCASDRMKMLKQGLLLNVVLVSSGHTKKRQDDGIDDDSVYAS